MVWADKPHLQPHHCYICHWQAAPHTDEGFPALKCVTCRSEQSRRGWEHSAVWRGMDSSKHVKTPDCNMSVTKCQYNNTEIQIKQENGVLAQAKLHTSPVGLRICTNN